MKGSDADNLGRRYVGTCDAAEVLGLAPGTLANWRYFGRGPKYVKLGRKRSSRVLYDLRDLFEYLDSKKVSPAALGEKPSA